MHITRRLTIVLFLVLGLVPLGLSQLLAEVVNREQVQEAFEQTLQEAEDRYRHRAAATATQTRSNRELTQAAKDLATVGKEKRDLRLQLARLEEVLRFTTRSADQLGRDYVRL